MKSFKNYIFFVLFSLITWSANAQSVIVSAKIDSSSMRIGEQRTILIEAEMPQSKNISVAFPIISQTDTLVKGLEILSLSKLDTTITDGAKMRVSQKVLVTSFDTGRYVVPPFVFSTNIAEYATDKIFLDVATIEADFEHAQITDNMENYDPGFNWFRFFLYLSILVILAGLGYIGYFIYQYIQKQKEMAQANYVEEDKRLPHEVALQELDSIKEKKVWQQGFTKQYYSNISDTLREYFTKRFNISAMEMTSTQIIDALRYNNDASPVMDRIRQIFDTSDMVKFAKQEPTQDENELSILNAYFIVNQTTVIPTEEEVKAENNEPTKDKEA